MCGFPAFLGHKCVGNWLCRMALPLFSSQRPQTTEGSVAESAYPTLSKSLMQKAFANSKLVAGACSLAACNARWHAVNQLRKMPSCNTAILSSASLANIALFLGNNVLSLLPAATHMGAGGVGI